MKLETTRIIDRYLSGELSITERKAFEYKLANNTQLQAEVELQRIVQEAAVRASFRTDVQRAARRYKISRLIRWGAAGLGAVAIIVSTSFWLSSTKDNRTPDHKERIINASLMDQLSPSADFDPLPIQYFSVPKEGDVFLSDQSVLLSIPTSAFLLKDKLYAGEAIVQFQEAIQANDIVKANLNTMTGDDLLETQGMFSIHAFTPEGEELDINPKVGVYIQVPVDEYKDGMQLYDMVELKNGKTDWQNPRGLSKIPVPVDMSKLDFYPEGYEEQLDNLKWKRQKKQRDSLYLSFEDYCPGQNDLKDISVTKVTSPSLDEESTEQISIPIVRSSMVVAFPDIDAKFPGGAVQMNKFISRTCQYPEIAKEQNISGRVYISMEVNEFGLIINERIERSVHPSLDKEALRIINEMPQWIPAQTNGQAVRSRVRLPINFHLESGALESKEKAKFNLMLGSVPAPAKLKFGAEASIPPLALTPQEESTEMASDSIELADTPCNYPHVSPSKVLAFWKPEFNNTNLSTREFESRMKAIHQTCSDAVLKKYTSQLTKSISAIDQEVVNMGYASFRSFSREQVGVVNPDNPHLANIKAFYEKSVMSLRKEAEKNENWEMQLRSKWDEHIQKVRRAHSNRTRSNKDKLTKEEARYNERLTVQKLGLNNQERMNPVATYPQFRRTIGFTARRSGGYNCDRAVRRVVTYQAALRSVQNPEIAKQRKIERVNTVVDVKNGTETRETFSVTVNGKTRTIQYNSLTFGVSHPEKYDKIMAYIFPHQLETYQLLDGDNGNFVTSLNNNIVYDICIVGISNDSYYYFQRQTLNEGSLGLIDLKKTTETKLDASIIQLNAKRTVKALSMAPELSWIKAEKKHYREVNRRKEMAVFREKIAAVVYPCYEGSPQAVIEESEKSKVAGI